MGFSKIIDKKVKELLKGREKNDKEKTMKNQNKAREKSEKGRKKIETME